MIWILLSLFWNTVYSVTALYAMCDWWQTWMPEMFIGCRRCGCSCCRNCSHLLVLNVIWVSLMVWYILCHVLLKTNYESRRKCNKNFIQTGVMWIVTSVISTLLYHCIRELPTCTWEDKYMYSKFFKALSETNDKCSHPNKGLQCAR